MMSYLLPRVGRGCSLSMRWFHQTPPAKFVPSLQLIQELRFRTEAGILDCRNALADCDGNVDEAIQWLRRSGAAKAVKKAARRTLHGVLAACCPSAPTRPHCAILEVGTETDFAARNDRVLQFVRTAKEEVVKLLEGEQLTASSSSSDPETGSRSIEEDEEALDELDAGRCRGVLNRIANAVATHRESCVAAVGENVTLDRLWLFPSLGPLQLAQLEAPPSAVLTGHYVHNGTEFDPDIGRVIGIVVLQPRSLGKPLTLAKSAANDFAQHLVANFGAGSTPLASQSFLGAEDETAGQWLKRHGVALRGATVVSFGAPPRFHRPAVHRKAPLAP